MRPPRRGAVVELLGAPGAGKSGLAEALAAHDGVAVVKDHERSDRMALGWSAARSWQVAVAPPPHVDRRRWAAWAARLGAARSVARNRIARGARMVVFDQGPAYTLLRMAEQRGDPGRRWWARRCSDTASLLDLLVLVDADTATLGARLRSREKLHRADRLGAAALDEYVDLERRRCHEVADALVGEGAEAMRLVTSELSVEEQVTSILEALAGTGTIARVSGRGER